MSDFATRFWSKVAPSTRSTCWEWMGSRSPDGYGQVRMDGRTVHASRAAWRMSHGPIPEGGHVLHRCDNRACVRPDHLFLGSNRDNVADRVAKGRTVVGRGARHWTRLYPERLGGPGYGRAKVTAEQVREMRRLYAAGGTSYPLLGRQFGLSHVAARKIVLGITYRNVV